MGSCNMDDFNYMRKLLYTFGPDLHLQDVLMADHKEISQQLNKEQQKQMLELIDTYDTYYEEIALQAFMAGFELASMIGLEIALNK